MRWIGDRRGDRGRRDEAHTWDRLQTPALLVRPVPGEKFSLESLDAWGEIQELRSQRRERAACQPRQLCSIFTVSEDPLDQGDDAPDTLRNDDAELGEMGPKS